MRPIYEIMEDVEASADELELASVSYPRKVAMHPNCPADLWWRLLVDHPIESMRSPAADLFLLEDPARYHELLDAYVPRWVSYGVTALDSWSNQHQWALLALHHVMDSPRVRRMPHRKLLKQALADRTATTEQIFRIERTSQRLRYSASEFYEDEQGELSRVLQETELQGGAEEIWEDLGKRLQALLQPTRDGVMKTDLQNAALIMARAIMDVTASIGELAGEAADVLGNANSRQYSEAYTEERIWQWTSLLPLIRGRS